MAFEGVPEAVTVAVGVGGLPINLKEADALGTAATASGWRTAACDEDDGEDDEIATVREFVVEVEGDGVVDGDGEVSEAASSGCCGRGDTLNGCSLSDEIE